MLFTFAISFVDIQKQSKRRDTFPKVESDEN